MFLWIAAIVVFLITFIGITIEERRFFWGNFFISCLFSIMAFGIAFIIAGITSLCAYDSATYVPVNECRTELVALQDNFGSSWVGRYHSSDEIKYSYLYDEEEKGITLNTIDGDETFINYIPEGEQPYVNTVTSSVKNPILRFFATDFLSQISEYYLYIPEGSIMTTNEYQIDLK